MGTVYVRHNGFWPREPNPSGGSVPFEPDEDLKRTRKKSTETNILCVGGPLHGVRIKLKFKIGHGNKGRPVSLLECNNTFTVPPYKGFYKYDSTENLYNWND